MSTYFLDKKISLWITTISIDIKTFSECKKVFLNMQFLWIYKISLNIKKSLWEWKCFSECNKISSEYENVSLNKIKFSLNIKAWILHHMTNHNVVEV